MLTKSTTACVLLTYLIKSVTSINRKYILQRLLSQVEVYFSEGNLHIYFVYNLTHSIRPLQLFYALHWFGSFLSISSISFDYYNLRFIIQNSSCLMPYPILVQNKAVDVLAISLNIKHVKGSKACFFLQI